jgi:general secretion pathway protein A
MYEAYWELQDRPFENCADLRYYYPSEAHQSALLKLRYAVENLINALRNQLADRFRPFVHVVFPQMSPRELLAMLAHELGAAAGPLAASLDETVICLQRFLAENAARGRHAVVAIDEAQLLIDSGALETMRLLLNFESLAQPGLTLILVGQPALLPALGRMPDLEERLAVKCLLRPLSMEETVSYVTHRLTAAGATREIFNLEALTALHQISRGNPRRINRLCDLALLVGFADEQAVIAPSQVEAVASELVSAVSD